MDFGNTSGIKSPFSPRVSQSITGRRPVGLSAKKTPSNFVQNHGEPSGEVIYKTPLATFETYGMPLPVMVTEALTFASGSVSVRMSACGWCWLVAGRRLLAWPLAAAAAAPPAARELTLPQTDLAHKADLVVVFYEDGAQMPSCVGVSPEGTVRYWRSVAGSAAADCSCELAGQECERLAEPCRAGLLLATTSGTAVLLRPHLTEGRAGVAVRTLRPAAGWLGGLGRRVSTLFFGSMPPHSDTNLVSAVVVSDGELLEAAGEDAAGCVALLSSGGLLSLWARRLHVHDVRALLPRAAGEPLGAELVALDMVAGRAPATLLLLLLAGPARADCKHALVEISVEEPDNPRVESLVWLRGGGGARGERAARLLPLPGGALLAARQLVLLYHEAAGAAWHALDVGAEGDRVLAAGGTCRAPLLLSAAHGLLRVRPAPAPEAACDGPAGAASPSDVYDGNLSLYEIDPHEVSLSATDACGKLKAAFLYHVRRDAAAAAALVRDWFPAPPAAPAPPDDDVDAVLDRTVLKIATEMLDDMPAGDPRWQNAVAAEGGAAAVSAVSAVSPALGASAALQLGAQLRDKQRALALFAEFLRAAGLWPRLGRVSAERGGCESTAARLRALAECAAAAAALRALQQQQPHAALLDAVLHQVATSPEWGAQEPAGVAAALASGTLASADVVYRRVSRVRRVLLRLAAARRPHAAPALPVLTSVVREMQRARAEWAAPAAPAAPTAPAAPAAPAPPSLSWEEYALLEAAAGLISRALAQSEAEPAENASTSAAAAALADALLAELPAPQPQQEQQQQEQQQQEQQQQQQQQEARARADALRNALIQPFVSAGQSERAAALAEKFGAYELLVQLLVRGGDMPRLYRCCRKYELQGLAEAAFVLLAADGAGAARLLRTVDGGTAARLERWLAAPQRHALLAALLLRQARHAAAARVLLQLARRARSLDRLTTLAALSKLCLCAGGEAAGALLAAAEAEAARAAAHCALPAPLRARHGLLGPAAPVRTPEELVEMYAEGGDAGLTEYDYKNALDLTDCVRDVERRDHLRLRIWVASILQDDWAAAGAGAAAAEGGGEGEALRRLTFFRLVDLVHLMGGDVAQLLPPAERLLAAPALAERAAAPAFCHLLRFGLQCAAAAR